MHKARIVSLQWNRPHKDLHSGFVCDFKFRDQVLGKELCFEVLEAYFFNISSARHQAVRRQTDNTETNKYWGWCGKVLQGIRFALVLGSLGALTLCTRNMGRWYKCPMRRKALQLPHEKERTLKIGGIRKHHLPERLQCSHPHKT